MKIKFSILLLLVGFIFVSCNNREREKNTPYAVNGTIDLRNINFYNKNVVKLDGEWELYWKKLLSPTDFTAYDTAKQTPLYFQFPQLWDSKKINDTLTLSGRGFATFRLKILVKQPCPLLAIRFNRIMTSSKIWIDKELVSSQGTVSDNIEQNRMQYYPKEIYFRPTSDTVEIVLQIANFKHKKGGCASSFSLGNAQEIKSIREKMIGFDLFITGVLIIMFLNYLGLFIFRPTEYNFLWFSLTCLFSTTFLMMNNEMIIYKLFPGMNWEYIIKVDFNSNYLRVLTFVLFLHSLFQNEFYKALNKVFIIFVSVLILVTICAPARIYTHLLIIFEIFVVLAFIYSMIGLGKAVINKREGVFFSVAGILFLVITGINDILHDNSIIQTLNLSPLGIFIFILGQSLIMSMRFSKSFTRTQELTIELQLINENLEEIVKKRTAEIEEQKEELEFRAENLKVVNNLLNHRNEEISAQRDEIEKTKNELFVKNQKIEQQHQDIQDSITYASKIQTAVLPKAEILEKIFPEYYILYKPKNIVSGDFYFFKKINNYFILVAADCTGHGVPGAFMSMLGISYLTEISEKREITSANEVLENFRDFIKNALQQKGFIGEQKDGMDIAFCSINLDNLQMQYAGANNSLYVIRKISENDTIPVNPKIDILQSENAVLLELKADRQPLAVHIVEKKFTTITFQLRKNDILCAGSDGYADQIGGNPPKKFMTKNLKRLLLEIHDKKLAEQKEILNSTFEQWKTGHEQIDDILIIGVMI